MTALLATNVRKARRQSECPICRRPILVGQLIAKCGMWMHATCLIGKHRHETGTEED